MADARRTDHGHGGDVGRWTAAAGRPDIAPPDWRASQTGGPQEAFLTVRRSLLLAALLVAVAVAYMGLFAIAGVLPIRSRPTVAESAPAVTTAAPVGTETSPPDTVTRLSAAPVPTQTVLRPASPAGTVRIVLPSVAATPRPVRPVPSTTATTATTTTVVPAPSGCGYYVAGQGCFLP